MKKFLGVLLAVSVLFSMAVMAIPTNAENLTEPVDVTATTVTTYDELVEALAKGGKITLGASITATEALVINKSVVIYGNGHSITSSASRVFQIYGENTTVEMNNVNVVDTAVRTGTNDIRGININPTCSGVKLTLNNCSVDFTDASASDWAYAVNVTSTAGACTLNINGGSYEGANVINVWGESTQVNIDGATLTSLYAANDLYVGACVKLEGANIDATVSNTTFEGANAVATDSAKDNCTFTTSSNTDNTKYYVAKVGSEYFYTIADAIAAANAGDTVTLTQDVETGDIVVVDKAITIDGNGHKVTSSASRVFQIYGENTTVEMNDVNVVDTAVRTGTNDIRGININPDCSGVELTLNNCSVDFTDASASDWAYGVNVTGTAGACTLNINGGSYEGANVINVWGESTQVNIDGATLTSLYAANDLYVGACVKLEGANIDATVCNTTFEGANAVATDSAKDNCTFTTSNNTDNTKYYVAKVGSEYFYTIADAIAAAKAGEVKTIVLLTTIVLDEDTVLDLTGLTVVTAATKAGNYVDAFTILADVTVTGGTVDARPSHGYTFYIGNKDGAAGNLIIEDGKFYGETSVVTNRHGNVTINGGEFDISLEKAGDTHNYVINCVDESYKNGDATITIKGGKFVGFNPANNAAEGTSTNFAAEGYVGVDNGDGTFGVKEEEVIEETGHLDVRAIMYTTKAWSFEKGEYVNRVGFIADLEAIVGQAVYNKAGFTITLADGSTKEVPAYGNNTYGSATLEGITYTPQVEGGRLFTNIVVFTDAELANVKSVKAWVEKASIVNNKLVYETTYGAETELN